jgi:hypothetical protein
VVAVATTSFTAAHFLRSGRWHGWIRAGGTVSFTVFGATTSVVVQPAEIRRHRLIEERAKVRILFLHLIKLPVLVGENTSNDDQSDRPRMTQHDPPVFGETHRISFRFVRIAGTAEEFPDGLPWSPIGC